MMNDLLQNALNEEKSGNFENALKLYKEIENEKLSTKDYIFVKRSVAACNFYLKKYDEAVNYFNQLLENPELNENIKNEIKDNRALCYLYGGKAEKAEEYFLKKINKSENEVSENAWNFWYLGQCELQLKNYAKMKESYSKAVKCAEKFNDDNTSFFISHLIAAEIINHDFEEINETYCSAKAYNDNSKGLLNIVYAVYLKIQKNENWHETYEKGIYEAEENHFVENIELGKFLLEKSDVFEK